MGTDYTATAVFTGDDPSFVGTNKTATLTVTLTEAGAMKYTLAQTTFDLTGQTIAQAPASEVTTADTRVYIARNAIINRTHDLRNILLATAQPVGTVSYTLGPFAAFNNVVSTPVLSSDGYTLEYTDGTGTGTVGNYSKRNIIISTTNYESISIDIWFAVTDKTPVTISGVSFPAKTYDGTAIAPTDIGSETITGGTAALPLRYYYSGNPSDGSYYTSVNTPPTQAGTYIVTISTDPDDNVAGLVDIPFVITKRPLTITAEDKTATVGDPAPAYTYTADLATGDTEAQVFATAPSLSCAYTNASPAGTYPITISGAVLNAANAYGDKGYNYEIVSYVAGTLTVSAAKTVSVGTQNETLTAGTADSATFAVTTANIADGTYTATLGGAPAGVTAGSVTINNDSGTLTLNTTTAVAARTYPLTLTVDGATSGSFNLVVGAAPLESGKLTDNNDGIYTVRDDRDPLIADDGVKSVRTAKSRS